MYFEDARFVCEHFGLLHHIALVELQSCRYNDFASLSAAVLGGERVPMPSHPDPFPQSYCNLIVDSGRDSVRPNPEAARGILR